MVVHSPVRMSDEMMCKPLRFQLANSLRNYRKNWLTGECRKAEEVAATGNHYQLIRTGGPRYPDVSEVIKGASTHSPERCLNR